MFRLLTRDQFREQVLARDKGLCVVCGSLAQDAHHILERRLWPDGGYYLDNGASVCGVCHIECEKTTISVEQVREAAGVVKIVPPDLYDDEVYDKWGNVITQIGRSPGPLFYDPNVQKILGEAGLLGIFVKWVKYPRTPHLPWSSGTSDDRILSSIAHFENQELVVTEKMDGENTTLYRDHIHARSLDSRNHPSRNWVKSFWSKIAHEIPEGWRVCGENLFARHTLEYQDLPSFFLGFSVWDSDNMCLSWDDTLEWFKLLGIEPVPQLARGFLTTEYFKALVHHSDQEGYVVRKAGSFRFREFGRSVAKYVCPSFEPNTHHWMHQKVTPNSMAGKAPDPVGGYLP